MASGFSHCIDTYNGGGEEIIMSIQPQFFPVLPNVAAHGHPQVQKKHQKRQQQRCQPVDKKPLISDSFSKRGGHPTAMLVNYMT